MTREDDEYLSWTIFVEKSIKVEVNSPPPYNLTFQPLLFYDRLYQTPSEICDILASNYANISSNDNYDPEFPLQKTSKKATPIEFSPLLITTTSLLQNLHSKAISYFTSLLNRIFESFNSPSSW